MEECTVVGRGRRARYVAPDLSYYWEGEGGREYEVVGG